MAVKRGFVVPVAVAELEVVEAVVDETEVVETVVDETEAVVPVEVEDLEIVADEEELVETTVPFRMYKDSLLPAPRTRIRMPHRPSNGVYMPQNSPPLPAQAMLHCVSGKSTLVLPRVFPQ